MRIQKHELTRIKIGRTVVIRWYVMSYPFNGRKGAPLTGRISSLVRNLEGAPFRPLKESVRR